MAEHERKMISKWTKDALSAARNRGIVLGNPFNLKLEDAFGVLSRKTKAEIIARKV